MEHYTDQQILSYALDRYGEKAQLLMAYEEGGEFFQALAKFMNGRGSSEHVIEEIADLENVLAQLHIIFGDEAIQRVREQKIDRLASRLGILDLPTTMSDETGCQTVATGGPVVSGNTARWDPDACITYTAETKED